MVFIGDDGDYKKIQELKKEGKYSFATCYDAVWGFVLPCESGMVWEQQTDGVCCHHVYIEGIMIPLRDALDIKESGEFEWLVCQIPSINYPGTSYHNPLEKTYELWLRIREHSHIDFEFIKAPPGMPPNQEGLQWILYHGHEEGWGNSFCIEPWKNKPIVMFYPNSD